MASIVLALSACATAYQPQGLTGGFSDTQLDTNIFRVSFDGNGYTNAQRAEEMALLRSAEITLKNGFTHFIIIDGRSTSEHGTLTTLVAAKPNTTNTIVCFPERPKFNGMVYDARLVFNSLGQRLGAGSAPK